MRHALLVFAAILLLVPPALGPAASAQVFERASSLPPADVEELDSTAAAHLDKARRFVAESQWDEAVESIRRVQEADAARLVKVDLARPAAGFERYVPAGEYCQWRLAALAKEAPPALTHYRQLVDHAEVVVGLEEELGDAEVGQAQLVGEVPPVRRRVGRPRVVLREGGDADREIAQLAGELDELGGVGEVAG